MPLFERLPRGPLPGPARSGGGGTLTEWLIGLVVVGAATLGGLVLLEGDGDPAEQEPNEEKKKEVATEEQAEGQEASAEPEDD